ncbi:MAG: 50S ribosomal protein L28 [Christensenellales bacterium]
MSRVCSICGKGKMKGNMVSHSNIKTNKHYNANVQKVKVEVDGKAVSEYVCTKCLKTLKD